MEKRLKTHRIVIRIGPSEKQLILRRAKQEGTTTTKFILDCIWGAREADVRKPEARVEAPVALVQCPTCKGSRGWSHPISQEWEDCEVCGGAGKI